MLLRTLKPDVPFAYFTATDINDVLWEKNGL